MWFQTATEHLKTEGREVWAWNFVEHQDLRGRSAKGCQERETIKNDEESRY